MHNPLPLALSIAGAPPSRVRGISQTDGKSGTETHELRRLFCMLMCSTSKASDFAECYTQTENRLMMETRAIFASPRLYSSNTQLAEVCASHFPTHRHVKTPAHELATDPRFKNRFAVVNRKGRQRHHRLEQVSIVRRPLAICGKVDVIN